jgi:hypothetical protein
LPESVLKTRNKENPMNRKSLPVIVSVLALLALLLISRSMAVAHEPGPQGALISEGAGAAEPLRPTGGGGPGPVSTYFSYQGQLKSNNTPVNGNCDFQFSLWDQSGAGQPPSGGTQIGITQTEILSVTNGLFSVALNFSSSFEDPAFRGDARWLQIAVRCPTGTGQYTTLDPRQPLRATPYALSLRPGAMISGTAYQVLKVASNAPSGGIPAGVTGEIYAATDGAGVYGGNYVTTTGATGIGVWGRTWSPLGSGVQGTGINGANGVKGTSTGGTGVYGVANNASGLSSYTSGAGVWGDSNNSPGVVGTSSSGVGVYGKSSGGILGYWNVGTYGYAAGGSGVQGESDTGTGVVGATNSGNLFVGCRWEGLLFPICNNYFRVSYTGTVFANGGYVTGGADVAEFIPASDAPQPGDVVEIDPDRPGQFRLAATPSSTAVAGVISTDPGVTLSAKDAANAVHTGPQLALTGRVPVKVNAENGAIRPGDLLVASSTPGHAMRAPANPAPGTVIGKALGRLDDSVGVIEMLVMLR